MPCKIRRASAGDATAIAELLVAAFAEYQSLFSEPAFDVVRPRAPEIIGRLAEGPVWVAVTPDGVVGTVSAVARGTDMWVRSMAVAPAARGQGVARRLLGAIEAWMRRRRFRRLHLTTAPFMGQAIRLYERAGFVPSQDPPEDLCGLMLLPMEKHIT